jgi:hypothetical protein
MKTTLASLLFFYSFSAGAASTPGEKVASCIWEGGRLVYEVFRQVENPDRYDFVMASSRYGTETEVAEKIIFEGTELQSERMLRRMAIMDLDPTNITKAIYYKIIDGYEPLGLLIFLDQDGKILGQGIRSPAYSMVPCDPK